MVNLNIISFYTIINRVNKLSEESQDDVNEKDSGFMNYFDEYDLNDNFNYENNDVTETSYIYAGSHLSVNEFAVSYLWLTQKLRISRIGREILLDFIRSLLPFNNNIPKSYRAILKSKKFSQPKPVKICSICYNDTLNCDCKITNFKKTIEVLKFNLQEQFEYILSKEWSTIKNYRSKLH